MTAMAKRTRCLSAFVAVFALCGTSLAADPPPGPPEGDGDSEEFDVDSSVGPKLSFTVSPVLLTKPIFRLSAEHSLLQDAASVALIGGIGTFKLPNAEGLSTRRTFYELGVQGRAYGFGSFRSGPFVGGQLRYLHFGSDRVIDLVISNAAQGVGFTPLAGFKTLFRDYMTFEFLVGPEIMLYRPTYDPPSPEKAGRLLLHFHISLGWTIWY